MTAPLESLSDFPSPDLVRPLTVEVESRSFWRLRRKLSLALIKEQLRTARLRLVLLLALSVFFVSGLGYMFYLGFCYLNSVMGADEAGYLQTIRAVYNIFFASLMMMLVFSSAIIMYSGLYRGPEAEYLLTTPARPQRIVLFKFHEAVYYSSWGFMLMASPMLLAYGLARGAPWHYYALLLPFVIAFVYIPCCLGAIFCLIVVDRLPRVQAHWLGLALAVIVALAGWQFWSFFTQTRGGLLSTQWFTDLLARLQVSEYRLLPSWWLSSGLLLAARVEETQLATPPWSEAVKYLAVLIANALFCLLLCSFTASRIYARSYSAHWGANMPRRITHLPTFDRLLNWLLFFLPNTFRVLMIKDMRLFRRDPVQWSQFLIFFGLLLLYFMNIRSFGYDQSTTVYVEMISFLNLAVVGLILSTFTTRFIYPLLSLEGQRIWILGLLPISRDAIVWSKFLFASLGSLVTCAPLILLSDLVLQVKNSIVFEHQVACVILCLGLSAIAVGLGAKMPNFREASPSKIAAGFGGTLNLVLSALFITFIVLVTALPNSFEQAAVGAENHPWLSYLSGFGGVRTAIVGGLIVTFGMIEVGIRAFRNMEF